ncbi:hypothetical protein GLOTRDRAFT_49931 [Gloeophyllum trabeum ATCC 11539]|uniref:DUF6532 domain-containing protein n=1 Tax=Gloeophyllum trabeum (strain ATCC 11539 / FP-39264 / Madison 617) TaxID=670483 RepID=S7PUC5_GLOTA|nr:uncharacterized protein GLOTRDRAFT_49931 [Gloeophyllum trabeum ATCC 11539]EPQ50927.1 hypothetical protein GLOTRDRAFT_49931 [Gloeophyllum trabeum ATCC 11539]
MSPVPSVDHHSSAPDDNNRNDLRTRDNTQSRRSSGEKRKRMPPPRSASPSGLRVVKARKLRSGGSRGRPRGKDWDILTRQVLDDAWGHFRARVSTEYPYPGQEEEETWAGEAWVKACRAKNIDMELEDELVKTIIQRGSQVRGKLKEQAVLLVPQAYGLRATASDKDIRENRDKVARLTGGQKPTFIYQNPDTRYRMYEHEIIQTLINATWFRKKNDTGVRYAEYFKRGIPLVTIALVLTAVENVLDEWATGKYVRKDFSERAYKETFEKHCRLLEDFREQTRELRVLKHIRLELLGNAR